MQKSPLALGVGDPTIVVICGTPDSVSLTP